MNTSRRTRGTGIALAAVTACVSGVSIYVNGYGVSAYGDATAYTTAKNAMAALVIGLAFALARSGRGVSQTRLTRPTRASQWWALAFVAVFGGAVPFVLFFEGLARTASTQAAFIHKTLVVWVAAIAVVALREKFTWWHGVAIALLVGAQWGLAGDVRIAADAGTAMIAGATAMWAVEVVLAKRLLKELSPWTVSLARMVGGSAVLVAWSLLSGAASLVPATAEQWSWVLITGLLLAAYVVTWHQALARAQAIDVTAVLVLGALVTAALAGAFKGAPVLAQSPWLVMLALGGALLWLGPRREVAT